MRRVKRFITVLVCSLFAIVLPLHAQALEVEQVVDFSEWVPNTYYNGVLQEGVGLLTPMGDVLGFDITGSDEHDIWSGLFKHGAQVSSGMLATISVSAISGNAEIGIMNSIGQIGNNRIRVHVYLEQKQGERRFMYRIMEREIGGPNRRVLTSGILGEFDGMWELDRDYTIGFVLFMNEFWIYVEGIPGFAKWAPFDIVQGFAGHPEVFAYVGAGEANRVQGTIKNVFILSE